MATKIARATQLQFGSTAGTNQIAEFGSLAAGTPMRYNGTTITPAIIQALANYLEGWQGAIIGENAPTIEDMNAVCYLFAYQLGYILQEGVPEWDSGTNYFIGSIAQDGAGNLYTSLTNSNINNALTTTANWRNISGGSNIVAINPATQTPYVMTAADGGKTFLVNSTNGVMQFNLPAPVLNFKFKIKDLGVGFNLNACTVHRFASELFEQIAADYVIMASGGEWEISSDGTNYFITGR